MTYELCSLCTKEALRVRLQCFCLSPQGRPHFGCPEKCGLPMRSCRLLPNRHRSVGTFAKTAMEATQPKPYNSSEAKAVHTSRRECEVGMESILYNYYSSIESKPVEWLWYPYIPLGKLTVLQGDPGDGKSTFAINLVALLTKGLPMPDGYSMQGSLVAIYQCAEDGMADTIKPRLEQAGADCEKVAYIVDNDIGLTLEDGRIEETIKATKANVFIVDPIQAFIPPESDMQSATKMRSVLRTLAATAEKYNCAVILIGHMNKDSGNKSLYRGLGSIDIVAIARSVLMISRDESRPDIRYMFPIKSSLAPEGPAIAFSIKAGGGLEWQGKYDLNTSALLDSVTVKTSKLDKARAKLVQMLQEHDRPSKEVFSSLAEIGVGRRTVEKIKTELQIRAYRSGNCWYWCLPKEISGETVE